MLPGTAIDGEHPGRWDRRPEFIQDEARDLDWIGEDVNGVWTRRHPVVALLELPEIWDVWTEWQFGQQEITAEDFATKSHKELEAKLTLVAATQRKHLPDQAVT